MKKWFKSWGSPAASPTPSSESVDEAATVTASDAGSKQRARSKSRSRGLNGAQSRRSRSRGSNRSSFQSQSLSEDVTEEKEAAPRLKQLIRLVSTSLSSTSNTPKSITPTSLVDIDDDFPAGIPADAPLSPVHFVSELVITKHSDEDKPEEAVVVREEGAINHDAQIALADLHISHLAQLEYEPTISVVHPLRIAIAAEAPLRPSTASPTELEYRRPPVNPVNLRRASMPVHSVFTQIPSSPSETTASFVVRKISADIISPIAKVIRRHSIMGITSLLSEPTNPTPTSATPDTQTVPQPTDQGPSPPASPLPSDPHCTSPSPELTLLSPETNASPEPAAEPAKSSEPSPKPPPLQPSFETVTVTETVEESVEDCVTGVDLAMNLAAGATVTRMQDFFKEEMVESLEDVDEEVEMDVALVPEELESNVVDMASIRTAEGVVNETQGSEVVVEVVRSVVQGVLDAIAAMNVQEKIVTKEVPVIAAAAEPSNVEIKERLSPREETIVVEEDVVPVAGQEIEVAEYVVETGHVSMDEAVAISVVEEIMVVEAEEIAPANLVEEVTVTTVEEFSELLSSLVSLEETEAFYFRTETESSSVDVYEEVVIMDEAAVIDEVSKPATVSVAATVKSPIDLLSPASDVFVSPVSEFGSSPVETSQFKISEGVEGNYSAEETTVETKSIPQDLKAFDAIFEAEGDDDDYEGDLKLNPTLSVSSNEEMITETASVQTKNDQIAVTLQALRTRLTYRTFVGPAEKEKLANHVLDLARPIFFPLQSANSVETVVSDTETLPPFEKSLALTRDEFEGVTICCRLPRHLTYALHAKILSLEEREDGRVSWREFEAFVEGLYRRFNPDLEALAFEILKRGREEKVLIPEDFRLFVEDVLENNSAFAFLASSPDFQVRFTETVIVRLFYSNHFHGRNRMTLRDFRTAGIYKVIAEIDGATNSLGLNIPAPFSYKDFYVIYCAFWELDKDHDMYLTLHDLERYSDRGLSHAALARVIECYGRVPLAPEGAGDEVTTVSMLAQNKIKCFGFKEFVAFIMAVEDKTSVSGLYYWFRVLDIDEDGLVSLLEIETFWEHQYTKVPEQYTVYDFFSLIIDLIKPESNSITLLDLKRNAKAAGLFLDFLLDSRRHVENIRRASDVSFRINDEVWVLEEDDEDAVAASSAKSEGDAGPIAPRRVRLEGWQKFSERRYRMLSGTSTEEEDGDDI